MLEDYPSPCLKTKFFGMLVESYVLYVRAQIEMALGRFDNAVTIAEKASLIDLSNLDIAKVLSTVKMVAKAHSKGNNLFNSAKFAEASLAYGEGLKYDGFMSRP